MIHKVIVTGPVGSGKTTVVNTLVGDKALTTDAKASDAATSKRKHKTTVAMDYGVVNLSNGDLVHIYGTPGQDRFDFMWDILCQGAHGLVLLLDNARKYPKRDLKHYTQLFSEIIDKSKFIVGITRADVSKRYSLKDYQSWLDELNLKADIMFIDARVKNDVQSLVSQLILPEKQLPASNIIDAVPEQVTIENSIEENDQGSFSVTDDNFQAIQSLKGVSGVTSVDTMGEVLNSTIDDEIMNDFIAYLSGITPILEEQCEMGEIDKILLRSPNDESLSIFKEQGTSVGVTYDRKKSIVSMTQQIEDILQWSE